MTWGKFILEGAEHDLTHLDPFTLNVRPSAEGAPNYKVLVSFSHHAFTRDLIDGDARDHHFGPLHDIRCFCRDRHKLSLLLPGFVRTASTGKAYFPARNHPVQRNFLLVRIEEAAAPYLVVFNLEKARNVSADAVMNVVSAHPRPDLPSRSRMDSIKVSTLVAKTVNGERIKRPGR